MDIHLTTAEYLASITKRCSRITAEEMMRNLESELERQRLGYGNYLFDDRHSPYVEWSVPGALDFSLMRCEGGFEVVLTTGPFDRDELSVHVEEGLLEVSGHHEEEDATGDGRRALRSSRRIPLPGDADLEGIHARYTDGTLVVKVPRPAKGRKEIAIE
jgi:HSP20 family molecular chaperone IbpA